MKNNTNIQTANRKRDTMSTNQIKAMKMINSHHYEYTTIHNDIVIIILTGNNNIDMYINKDNTPMLSYHVDYSSGINSDHFKNMLFVSVSAILSIVYNS